MLGEETRKEVRLGNGSRLTPTTIESRENETHTSTHWPSSKWIMFLRMSCTNVHAHHVPAIPADIPGLFRGQGSRELYGREQPRQYSHPTIN